MFNLKISVQDLVTGQVSPSCLMTPPTYQPLKASVGALMMPRTIAPSSSVSLLLDLNNWFTEMTYQPSHSPKPCDHGNCRGSDIMALRLLAATSHSVTQIITVILIIIFYNKYINISYRTWPAQAVLPPQRCAASTALLSAAPLMMMMMMDNG